MPVRRRPRRLTVPRHAQPRRPSRSRDHLAVVPRACPCGAPSALATASLAAKRAASEVSVRGCPSSVTRSRAVKSRSRRPGVRASDAEKRGTFTTSMPIPTITVGQPATWPGTMQGWHAMPRMPTPTPPVLVSCAACGCARSHATTPRRCARSSPTPAVARLVAPAGRRLPVRPRGRARVRWTVELAHAPELGAAGAVVGHGAGVRGRRPRLRRVAASTCSSRRRVHRAASAREVVTTAARLARRRPRPPPRHDRPGEQQRGRDRVLHAHAASGPSASCTAASATPTAAAGTTRCSCSTSPAPRHGERRRGRRLRGSTPHGQPAREATGAPDEPDDDGVATVDHAGEGPRRCTTRECLDIEAGRVAGDREFFLVDAADQLDQLHRDRRAHARERVVTTSARVGCTMHGAGRRAALGVRRARPAVRHRLLRHAQRRRPPRRRLRRPALRARRAAAAARRTA